MAFDIFGTTFDWYSGVCEQIADISRQEGLGIDPGRLTEQWREEFFAALASVRSGRRAFAILDVLHGEGLDRILGVDRLAPATRERLVRTWHRLPAWPDAEQGLTRLREGYTVAALSNGGFAQTVNLIKNAGLPFDCVLSAQLSRHYKPEPQVYRTAVDLLDLQPHQVLMVAAHDWDLDGARAVGFRTAYVRRPREQGPNRPPAQVRAHDYDVVVDDFRDLADKLLG